MIIRTYHKYLLIEEHYKFSQKYTLISSQLNKSLALAPRQFVGWFLNIFQALTFIAPR